MSSRNVEPHEGRRVSRARSRATASIGLWQSGQRSCMSLDVRFVSPSPALGVVSPCPATVGIGGGLTKRTSSLHPAKRDKATLIMSCWTGSTNQGESRQNSEASLSCLQSPVRRWARPYQTAHPGKARPTTGRSGELLEPGPPQDLIGSDTMARGLPVYPRIRPASPPHATPPDLQRSSRLHLFAIDFTSQRRSVRDFFINP
jgi:hypothetical protein